MAYYVGTQQFPSIYEASRFLAQNPQPGATITSAPVTPAGMLTKPAPTTKQTGPVGMPSSDPTKTQPGETGPFDPNAEPPAPAPAPEPEAELAPPKPLQDTKEPAPEPEGVTTFTFFRGDETGDANPAALYNRGDSTQLTQAELQEYFNADSSGMLQNAFGNFNNYLSYMTEREQLIQSGDYDVGNWVDQGVTEAGLTEDQMMLFEGDADLTVDPSDPLQNIENIETSVGTSRQTAYDRWVNSEANQALLKKYGVNSTIYNDDGDKYEWNGSAYVKTYKVDDHMNVGDYIKAGTALFISLVGAPAWAEALTAAGATAGSTSAIIANASAGAIASAANQLILTGEVDFSDVFTAAAMSGAQEFIGSLFDSNNTNPDEIRNQVQMDYITKADEARAAGDLAMADFYEQVANQVGNIDISDITDPSWQNVIVNLAQQTPEAIEVVNQVNENVNEARDEDTDDVNSELVNQILENVQPEPDTPLEEPEFEIDFPEPTQEEPEPDLPIEIEPPTLPEEDILADTTQEATGLEASVIEDLFSDYMDEFRQEFEGQQNITIDQVQEVVANALGSIEQPETLTQEQVQQIVNDAVSSIPQADTLSEQQVQDIVNNAVSSIEIPEGITTEEVQNIVNEAVSGIPAGTSPEQVQDIVNEAISGIVIPEGMTPEQVQQIVDTAVSGIQFPEGISTEDVQGIVDQAVSNIQFPEAVSTEQVQNIVDAAVAGIDIPEGISEEQVGNIVDTAIANIEFPEGVTQEQVNQIVNQAVGDIEFPEGVTQDQVTQIVNTAIAGIKFPEIDTLSTEEVEGIVNTAISGIEFPEGVTADQVLNIVQEQLATQPEDLTADEVNNIVSAAINSIEFPASVTQEEVVDLLSDVQNTLTSDFESYQEGVREELEVAEEERAVLGGQLGTLTEEVADIATDLINVGGDIEDLDQRTQDRLDELGLDLEGIGLLVNVNFEALQEGMLTQESALRELVEETTQQTEQSLTERLEEAEQGFATNLSDTEANLLEQITGVEAGVLQQLAEVEGGLQSQFGEQFEQVQQQVSGLGEQVAGVGENIGQLGQALGAGLLGLAAAQPTAQEIAAAMPRQPVKFDPFLKGLSPFQPLTPLSLSPIQEKDATSELNKFIGRQTGMLV
jgi:hypothetical protein